MGTLLAHWMLWLSKATYFMTLETLYFVQNKMMIIGTKIRTFLLMSLTSKLDGYIVLVAFLAIAICNQLLINIFKIQLTYFDSFHIYIIWPLRAVFLESCWSLNLNWWSQKTLKVALDYFLIDLAFEFLPYWALWLCKIASINFGFNLLSFQKYVKNDDHFIWFESF